MSEIEEADFSTTPFANARPAPVEMTVFGGWEEQRKCLCKSNGDGL
jgi:hypothetical protein